MTHPKKIDSEFLEEALSATSQNWRDGQPASPELAANTLRRLREENGRPAPSRRYALLPGIPVLVGSCALVLAIAIGMFMSNSAGAVSTKRGRVTVSGLAGKFDRLMDGSVIRTGSNSTSIVDLDNGRVRVFLADSTTLSVEAEDETGIVSGSVWVSVTPNSGRFVVATPAGDVEVHGTSFGIQTDGNGARIYLAAGAISLHGNGGVTRLAPDQFVDLASPASDVEVRSVAAADGPPEWATRLYQDYQITYSGSYFPSSRTR